VGSTTETQKGTLLTLGLDQRLPFCGLAVLEELTGSQSAGVDPELEEHCMVSLEPGPCVHSCLRLCASVCCSVISR